VARYRLTRNVPTLPDRSFLMKTHRSSLLPAIAVGAALLLSVAAPVLAQAADASATGALSAATDFTVGPEDVLGVLVWREAEMSGDVTVRADGMITLPLLRDVEAAGLTPNELAEHIQERLREYVTDASVTVVVRQMNSRRVFITGEVGTPGAYPLASPLTVMQLIAIAGGLTEFADANGISVMRTAVGKTTTLKFQYKDVAKGKKPEQNVQLKPGDTVVVPER
jgi:polysaccharide biosynthesis/export protein